MISKLANQLTDKLLSNGTIDTEDKELYDYGIFMLISHLFFFIVTCVLGLVLKCLLEGIVFYVAFMLIRGYAGGYHAKTETRCEIMSAISILCCIVLIKCSKMYDFNIVLLSTSLVFAVLIFTFCPLDTPEKPLTDKEHKYFRKISLIILSLIIVAIIISFIFKFNIIFVPCCVSVILEGVLIGIGQIKKAYSKKRANSQV